ncbi:T9SS type A sorting domain-containing protein [Leptobacterium flavescens]|uniref:T9SS type A sorting domain-containing protein n=1 Tax=Leptobacterium flavescens TaxID=472055 RepID=A0A6P0UUW7_9FLAO|nr:T9SS type A sorting domain-containing protein [Leptobacterium flavescens]NER14613.1 T9SS type A sorting domain-containing protein [Leptobacterium flavescens]
MKKNYLLTFIALLVMHLSIGQSDLYQDSPPDFIDADRFSVEAVSDSDPDQQKEIDGFKMYPNPVTNGLLTITSNRNLTKNIRIYNVLGKEVMRTTLTTTNTLNVSTLVPGVYLLKVTEANSQSIRKLVIK